MNQQEGISIKGIRQGLLIGLGPGLWASQLALLEQRLDTGAAFFKGGRVALDVGDRRLDAYALERVQRLLARYEVELWALLSTCDDTALAAARLGLAINLVLGDRLERLEEEVDATEEPVEGALIVERTLRSGQRIHHHGSVVVIGDVHSGAEVVAGGHIVVWGKLHGFAHAGVLGDESAVVCALDLAPTQLRIANYFSRSPDEKGRRPEPEMARVEDDQIEAVPWHQQ